MIRGVGTDILQISRMEQALARTPALAQRILTSCEYEQFLKISNSALFLAKRFCAKEAVSKALGTGIGRGVSWKHIEITKDQNGRPEVTLSEGALDHAERLEIASMHLSYSDEKEYIVAFVVAEGLRVL